MRRAWVRSVLFAVLVLASTVSALAFLHWLRWLPEAQLDRVDKISSGLGPPVALAGLLVAIGSWWAQRAAAPTWTAAEQERLVHDHLAATIARSLAEEATRRDLHPPFLQPIRWTAGDKAGTVHDLAGFFATLPVRQLVLLGAPGSGKSSMALRLALDLAGDGDLIPMIVPVTSWDRTQRLDTWLAEVVRRHHPELRDAARFGTAAPARAVGRILPILDGFDEIPPGARPPVLRHLRDELAAGRPLVLVSQELPFRAAVAQAGVTLARATEVEVQPLEAGEAAGYLPAGQHDGEKRWRAVVERIEQKPHGGLARLFSSPLTIYLARTAYDDPARDPGELVGMTVPQARAALMNAFLPAVYGRRADPSLRSYRADTAERWLRFLARRMTAQGMSALPWWRLHELSPVAVVTLRFTVSLLTLVLVGMRYGLPIGFVAALVTSFAVGRYHSGAWPDRVIPRAGPLIAGAVAGVATAVAAATFLIPSEPLVVPVLFGLVIALSVALLANAAAGVARDADDPGLHTSLRDDRNVLLAVLAIAVVSGVRSAAQWGPWMGVQQFGRFALLTTATLAFANAGVPWLRFFWARLFLAGTRRLPLRLVTFLDDAHRRGVLRRSGATYEFRHSSFLRHLSS